MFEKCVPIDPNIKACFNKTRGVGKTDKKWRLKTTMLCFPKNTSNTSRKDTYERTFTRKHPSLEKNFHLVSCLARLTKRTWQDSDEYEIIEEGFRRGHGHYYMYVFTLRKVIGTDPWGLPTKKILIYYAWRPWMDGRFHIISSYPYSSSYHYFLKARKYGSLS